MFGLAKFHHRTFDRVIQLENIHFMFIAAPCRELLHTQIRQKTTL